ncbi:hypothetical protein HDU96_008241 [Phlyctochytrium bullatum]|nr:hypothetical protein HDU96_008241 [Phlyctochytrium bullatum]
MVDAQPEKSKRAQVFEIDDVTAEDISDIIDLLKRKKRRRVGASAALPADTFDLSLSIPTEKMPTLVQGLLAANSELRSRPPEQEMENERLGPGEEQLQPALGANTVNSQTPNDKEKFALLVTAAERNDAAAVRELLSSGAEWKVKDSKGRLPIEISSSPSVWAAFAEFCVEPATTLWQAAESGDAVSFKLLIGNGHDFMKMNEGSATLLHIASYSGIAILVKLCGVGIDRRLQALTSGYSYSSSECGMTALHAAASGGHASAVRTLCELGANVNAITHLKQTALHVASEKGYLHVARVLLEFGADAKVMDGDENTPLLFVASTNGNVRLAELILSHLGPCYDLNEDFGKLLHNATEAGNYLVAELFIKKGANVNAMGRDGSTALHIAARMGHEHLAELLLENGANAHALRSEKFEFGQTMLSADVVGKQAQIFEFEHATAEDIIDIIDSLRRLQTLRASTALPTDSTSEGQQHPKPRSFHLGLTIPQSDMADLVQELLKSNSAARTREPKISVSVEAATKCPEPETAANDDIPSYEADSPKTDERVALLFAAAESNDEAAVRDLIASGVDCNVPDEAGLLPIERATLPSIWAAFTDAMNPSRSTLKEATEAGDGVSLRLLVGRGEDPTTVFVGGMTPIHIAVQYGFAHLVELLVQHCGVSTDLLGGDPYRATGDGSGETALHVAARFDKANVTEMLCDLGADLNAKTSHNALSPLEIAVVRGHFRVTKVLLERGADSKAADREGNTILHRAAKGPGNLQIMSLLLRTDAPWLADVEARGSSLKTALHVAAESGKYVIARTLILHGADVNAKALGNCTPLHAAAYYGHRQLVELLVSTGADLGLKATVGEYRAFHMHTADADGKIFEFENATAEDIIDIIDALRRLQSLRASTALPKDSTTEGQQHPKPRTFHLGLTVPQSDMADLVRELLKANSASCTREPKISISAETAPKGPELAVVSNDDIPSYEADAPKIDERLSLLFAAAERDDEAAVRDLIASGVDCNIPDEAGLLPIEKATLPSIWAAFTDAMSPSRWTLKEAAEVGDGVSMRLLVGRGEDATIRTASGMTPLHIAAKYGFAHLIELLVKHCGVSTELLGGEGEAKGETPLYVASRENRVAAIEALCNLGADLNSVTSYNSFSPLETVVALGHFGAAKALLERGADAKKIDRCGNGLLHHAAQAHGNQKIVELLLRADAPWKLDVNARGLWSKTSLHVAAESGKYLFARSLILHGADINATAEGGCTPLHAAAFHGHRQLVQLLVSEGADLGLKAYVSHKVDLLFLTDNAF